MPIIALNGISHKTAPIEVREKFSLTLAEQEATLRRLQQLSGIHEAAILNTCNRLELYLIAESESAIFRATTATFLPKEKSPQPSINYQQFLYQLRNQEALLHLFRVSASIDSMILGEPQILSQVKGAVQFARQCHTAGTLLNNWFNRAIIFGKRIRTQTNIGRGALSIPFAAVSLILNSFESLEGKKIVIIGSGKMSEIAARRLLMNTGAELIIASRSPERAKHFAERVKEAKPVEFHFSLRFLQDADVVLTSTDAPHFLIHQEQMEEIMRGRNFRLLLIVDIAVPRNVDPEVKSIAGIKLYNLDDLQNIVDKNLEERQKEAEKIELLAKAEAEKFQHWMAVQRIKPVIIAFRQYVKEQCAEEIGRLRHLFGEELTQERERYLRRVAQSIANKISHQPLTRIKEMIYNGRGTIYAEILKEIFSLSPGEKSD